MAFRREVGRPLKFQSVEELQKKIDLYFLSCEPQIVDAEDIVNGKVVMVKKWTERQPYTMAGLAMALGVNRETILTYTDRPEFSATIQAARIRVEQFAEKYLYSGKPTTGAQFALKNNHGYVDRAEITVNHALSLQDTIKSLELGEDFIEGQIVEQKALEDCEE